MNTKDIASSWLQGLAARGVTASIRNGRLWLHPKSAYRELTDDEMLTLRHHRDAIKALVNAPGMSFDVAHVRTASPVENVEPTAAPEPACPYCYRAPCIGVEHDAYYALHPVERRRRDDERLTAEMHAAFARPRQWGLL